MNKVPIKLCWIITKSAVKVSKIITYIHVLTEMKKIYRNNNPNYKLHTLIIIKDQVEL